MSTLRNQSVETLNLFLGEYFCGKRNQLISVVIAGFVGNDRQHAFARPNIRKRFCDNRAQLYL